MKVPLAFLKEYIQIDSSVQELSDLLTLAGIEVDSIENPKITFTGVIVAKVESAERHPNADKLQIATVFDGTDRWQVVCGAPNCREGLITAFAKIGATLQEGEESWTVKKAKLRGVESSGMLASAKELGLYDSHEGIIELPDEMEIGKELSTYFKEPILEISLTPNLGHCMSILGIAKEIRAHTGQMISLPCNAVSENPNRTVEKNVTVTVEAKKSCPRYCLRLIEDLQEAQTPYWIKQCLYDSGLRPVHPVVDILNFVMLETGQPLHAFDYDSIAEKTLIIAQTDKEEEFIGLDDEKRTIPAHTIVIKDPHKTLAIAGILGGKTSSITHKTTSILLESADFDGITIRKSSQKLALRTDSSMRFEKGIDGGNSLEALNRASHLIEQICKGKVASGSIDIQQKKYVGHIISVRVDRVNHLLGTHLSLGEIESIFVRLGCLVKAEKEHSLQVQVPTARNDLTKEIDLVEEVARIYGYNHIPKPSPLLHTSKIPHATSYLLEKELRKRLTREGLQEFLNCDIISPDAANICLGLGLEESSFAPICLASSSEYSVMRPSLLPGLLQVIKNNQDQKIFSINAFELGYRYLKKEQDFSQQPLAAIVLSGDKFPKYFDKNETKWDFFDLKGMLENLFSSLNIPSFQVIQSSFAAFHPHLQAEILIGPQSVGVWGQVHPKVLEKFDIKQPVYFAEINTIAFLESFQQDRLFQALPTYPGSDRDWTVTVARSLSIQTIFDEIRAIASPLLESYFCLDLFEKDPETKNLTFRFVYRSREKTLSHDEVEREHQEIIARVTEKLKELAISSSSQ